MDYSYYTTPHQSFAPFGLSTPQPPNTQTENFRGAPHSDHFNPPPPYDPFADSFRFDPNTLIGPVPPHSPPDSFSKNSSTSNDFTADPSQQTSPETGEDAIGEHNAGRSSSEEKESLTPAQSRRKAQNRAAQRAFRERKERHVRELEQKLNDLEQASTTLHADNERLKRELAKYATENEILRATAHSGLGSNNGRGPQEATTTGPMQFSPTDFYSSVLKEGEPSPVHRITVSEETGERLLDAGATWDLIQQHEMFKRGLVDIGVVCERLRGVARCDGQGPVFEESRIRKAIEESVAGGSDELI
ncbi:transcriptional regulator family: bZIP [Paecilomyces variotii]|nr:transcriptional regulator family: bZIP [Paecilomyces variotii]KAJ9314637.1 transcriptional regulator family: bZIP [Paecilomyces variotii]KAJ9407224.1 transcriptional regulator family: bZIP [Paecilomyces variotii]